MYDFQKWEMRNWHQDKKEKVHGFAKRHSTKVVLVNNWKTGYTKIVDFFLSQATCITYKLKRFKLPKKYEGWIHYFYAITIPYFERLAKKCNMISNDTKLHKRPNDTYINNHGSLYGL